MRKKAIRLLSATAVGALSIGSVQNVALAAADAQRSEGGVQLDEVTVTAERFSSTVQSTPIAVTAVTADELAERNINTVLQAAEAVPGVLIVPGASSIARVSMRGSLQSLSGIRSNAVVGIYIDDVIQPRPNGALFDFFDIDTLEVLRGPQGTLYGRNTPGGAIKVQTKRPSTTHWTGSAEVGFGNREAREGKVYLSGPIVEDTLAISVSGVMRQREGFIYGLQYGEHVGDVDNSAERVKLLYTPNDKLEVNLSVFAIQDYSDMGVAIPLTLLPGVDDPYASPNRRLTFVETAGSLRQHVNNTGASLNVTYDVSDAWQLQSITGYGNLRFVDDGSELILTPAIIAQNGGQLSLANEGRTDPTRSEFFSQEVNAYYQSDRVRAVGGVYYFHEDGRALQNMRTGVLDDRNKTEAAAVFGQVSYVIGGGFGVTAGLRYTRETQDYYSFQTGAPQGPQSGKGTWTALTPKFGFDWEINPNILAYVSWTKGYRAGGFNPRNPNTGEFDPTPYGEETVDSYEAGVKFTSENRRFRLNAATYLAKYEDLQLPVFMTGTDRLYTINASGARVRGIELEPTWQVFDSLQLYGNLSFTSGKYTDSFMCQGAYNQVMECRDKKLKGLVPEQTVVGFKFTPSLPIPGELTLDASWRFNDAHYNNTSNEPLLDRTEAQDLYNASIRWQDDAGRWYAALDGRNLDDNRFVQSTVQRAHATQPATSAFVNTGREVIFRVGLNF
jgi:iron complex outermembrane receptor protein